MPTSSRVKLVVALVAVSGALVGATTAAARWRADNAVWRSRAVAAEAELVQVKPELDAARTSLAELEEESETLHDRVAELANEKAEVQDSTALAQVERAAFERLAKEYAAVTEKWAACVDGHEQYERVLMNKSKYDAAQVQRFVRDLEATCEDARKADDELRSQLSR